MSWSQPHIQSADNVIYLFRDHVTSSPVTSMCELDTFSPKSVTIFPQIMKVSLGPDVQISSSGHFFRNITNSTFNRTSYTNTHPIIVIEHHHIFIEHHQISSIANPYNA